MRLQLRTINSCTYLGSHCKALLLIISRSFYVFIVLLHLDFSSTTLPLRSTQQLLNAVLLHMNYLFYKQGLFCLG
jgi:hypothetical protein